MQTKRPRLLIRPSPSYSDERREHIDAASRQPAIGDRVFLAFRSRVRYVDGSRAHQGLGVSITREIGEGIYRGEIDSQPDRRLFTADELRRGQPVKFRTRNIFILYR